MDSFTYWVTHYGYGGIFVLLMVGIVGIPIPDESLLAFAGYLVSKGELQLLPTLAVAFAGSVCGITLSYGLGRTLGSFLLTQYGHFIHLTAERLGRAQQWFDRVGKWGLVFGYFLPGVRHLVAIVAGTSKLRLPVFTLFAYTGGLLWSMIFILIGYFLGKEWAPVVAQLRRHMLFGFGALLILLLLALVVQHIRRKRSAQRDGRDHKM